MIALVEEDVICITGNWGGMLLESLDQLGIGDECRWV
jgi:hypothetical protein